MQEVQLYISGEKVNLFKDETISLNDSIQNVRDISKIFTAFTKQFNLPASRTNNKIFKHFYNYDITAGFDARFKVDALIKLNGVDFKKGKLRLNTAELKDNVAYSYKVVFFGETVTLSDLLGDDDLKALGSELTDFDQIYSASNTLNGLTRGWTLSGGTLSLNSTSGTATGDFIYPFISSDKRYFYDTSTPATNDNNIWISSTTYVTGNLKGLHFVDLKPAIKVIHLIKAIETKYGLTFSTDFFSSSNENFDDLFLWLHREKGSLSKQIGISSYEVRLNEWALTSPDTELRTDENTTLISSFVLFGNVVSFEYKVTVNVTGSGLYDIVIINNNTGDIYYEDLGLAGNITECYSFNISDGAVDYPKLQIKTVGGITAFNTSLQIIRTTAYSGGENVVTSNYTFNGGGDITLSTGLTIGDNLPKMQVIDFLTSLFKMFNLTAYVENDIIVVKTLDDYYSEGVDRDITKYIDVSKQTVSRSKLYSKIDFKFKPPKTLFAITTSEINNFEFGNLKFKANEDTYDGGGYAINIAYEKMVYERMVDDNTGSHIDYQWGYFVDKDEKPTVGAPLLFYAQKQTASDTAYFDNGSSYQSFTKYMKPANTRGDGLQTINFGSEIDEFFLNTNTESLFANFYDNYISNLFNVRARIIKVTAFLPLSFMLNYSLADTVIISGNKYRINNIKINLQTRKSELELINIV